MVTHRRLSSITLAMSMASCPIFCSTFLTGIQWDESVKVKYYVMNESDGTLQLMTKHYKYMPKELEEHGQWLIYNAEKKEVCKICCTSKC